jgi:hypothetical protein
VIAPGVGCPSNAFLARAVAAIGVDHRDEAAARAAYPGHLPTSVTLLSFHAPGGADGEPPVLTVDRHGSLPVDEVRRAAAPLGLRVRIGATAQRRLQVRGYAGALV